jgi:hypothetical protein
VHDLLDVEEAGQVVGHIDVWESGAHSRKRHVLVGVI